MLHGATLLDLYSFFEDPVSVCLEALNLCEIHQLVDFHIGQI